MDCPWGLWNYANEYGTVGDGLTTNIMSIEGKVDNVFNVIIERDATLTYTTNGVHSPDSLHPSGDAIDLRVRGLSSNEKNLTTKLLKDLLGHDYDVINEGNHIHIKYDSKSSCK